MTVSLDQLLEMDFPEEKRARRKRGQGMSGSSLPGLPVAVQPGEGNGTVLASTSSAQVASTVASATPAAETLAIAQIRRDGGTQPRQGLNEEVVTEYKEARLAGADFPAVDVVFDGNAYWLSDGFHRVEAYLRAGDTEIAVRIIHGTQSEAQWRSYGANRTHGLRRSTEDKQRAVRLALAHPNAAGKSNRAIAEHVGVDDKTVAKYRAALESSSEIPKIDAREVERGGRRYVMPTANIGPGKVSLQAEYAPVYVLQSYVRQWLQGHLAKPDRTEQMVLLRAMREAGETRSGLESWLKEAGACWRRAELTQAINNVLNQMEVGENGAAAPVLVRPQGGPTHQQGRGPLPAWAAGVAPAPLPPPVPKFMQETLPPAEKRPLAGDERQAAVAVELAFWQSSLLHLALVGDLTGQYSAVLGLRRELEKVIQLYRQEGGYEKL